MTTETPRRRSIRSFVRRGGRMTTSQEKALEELWPTIGLDYSDEALDIASVFGAARPLTIEVGFGNGDSLVQLAAEHPAHSFLGIEVHEPGIGHCLIAARRAEVSNLRLICHDAIDVLKKQLPKACADRFNLYFPDPWPKKRHHKRRILNDRFLTLVHRCLASDGRFHIATDWANYAEHIDELFATSELFELDKRREHDGDRPLDRPPTKFERRGLRKGHRIVDWRFRRND